MQNIKRRCNRVVVASVALVCLAACGDGHDAAAPTNEDAGITMQNDPAEAYEPRADETAEQKRLNITRAAAEAELRNLLATSPGSSPNDQRDALYQEFVLRTQLLNTYNSLRDPEQLLTHWRVLYQKIKGDELYNDPENYMPVAELVNAVAAMLQGETCLNYDTLLEVARGTKEVLLLATPMMDKAAENPQTARTTRLGWEASLHLTEVKAATAPSQTWPDANEEAKMWRYLDELLAVEPNNEVAESLMPVCHDYLSYMAQWRSEIADETGWKKVVVKAEQYAQRLHRHTGRESKMIGYLAVNLATEYEFELGDLAKVQEIGRPLLGATANETTDGLYGVQHLASALNLFAFSSELQGKTEEARVGYGNVIRLSHPYTRSGQEDQYMMGMAIDARLGLLSCVESPTDPQVKRLREELDALEGQLTSPEDYEYFSLESFPANYGWVLWRVKLIDRAELLRRVERSVQLYRSSGWSDDYTLFYLPLVDILKNDTPSHVQARIAELEELPRAKWLSNLILRYDLSLFLPDEHPERLRLTTELRQRGVNPDAL